MKILVINGPNLNFVGIRETNIYGEKSYKQLMKYLKQNCPNSRLKIVQTNSEAYFIYYLQKTYFKKYDGIVINPGAYSHYSYAIMDAIKSINMKVVEVHLSDVLNREDFRSNLITGSACNKVISGKGIDGYIEAVKYIEGN